MIKKYKLVIAAAAVLGMGSFGSFAGGEAVNCRTETVGKQAIYSGWASCSIAKHTLGQYFYLTTVRSQLITEWVGGRYLECRADVPFDHYADITKTVCDYKPTASIYAMSSELEGSIIRANGSDKDGTIVKKELWINDVLQSSSSVLRLDRPGTVLRIKAKVTDSQGYTDQTSKSYTVQQPQCQLGPINEC